MNIGLFYGSSTSNTEYEAYIIKEEIDERLGEDTVEVYNIGGVSAEQVAAYDNLIFGIPTWDIGQLQEDWDAFWDQLDKIDFQNKTIAIFGPGDPYGYPDTFLDAVGILGEKVLAMGANLIGYWPTENYEFEDSIALALNKKDFMGLALDEDNQPERTEERIQEWVPQILEEFEKAQAVTAT